MINRFYTPFIFLVSGFALIFAYFAQYGMGFEPCILCVYARIPYWIALGLSAISLLVPFLRKYFSALSTVIFLAGSGLSFYHVGIELKIFDPPLACGVSRDLKDLSLEDLEKSIMKKPVVRCDVVTLRILTRSASEWNFLLFLFLTLLSGWIWIKKP
jgi:disulfide bond formation protein DsbB